MKRRLKQHISSLLVSVLVLTQMPAAPIWGAEAGSLDVVNVEIAIDDNLNEKSVVNEVKSKDDGSEEDLLGAMIGLGSFFIGNESNYSAAIHENALYSADFNKDDGTGNVDMAEYGTLSPVVNHTGTVTTVPFEAIWTNPPTNTNGALRLDCDTVGQGGRRIGTFTLKEPVQISEAALIEFDWRYGVVNGGTGNASNQGGVSICDGSGNKIVTLFVQQGQNGNVYAVVEDNTKTDAEPVKGGLKLDGYYPTGPNRSIPGDWYHVEVKIVYGQYISITLTDNNGVVGERATFKYPTDTVYDKTISAVQMWTIRDSGGNINFIEDIDNLVISEDASDKLAQIGSTIDFDNGLIPGRVSSSAVTIMDYDGSKVLNVNPLAGSASASHEWVLPLNEGEYDITGKDIVEFNFDWWAEYARPWQNMFDVRFISGSNRMLALRSDRVSNDNAPWYAAVKYAVGNSNPQNGTGNITIFPQVSRLTKYNVTVNLNLAAKVASLQLKNEDGEEVFFEDGIILSSSDLTSLSFGGYRDGANWAGGAGDWAAVEATYGGKIDNIVISAGMYSGEIVAIPPASIKVSPASASLECGGGALADKGSATFDAIIEPANVDDKAFIWTTSDESVAAIETNADGSVTVTAVSAGTAIITATSRMAAADGLPVTDSVTVHVAYVAPITEPVPDFDGLYQEGYQLEFGSNFDPATDKLWIFGGTYSSLARETEPRTNHYFRFDASGSGNRGTAGELPYVVSGSKIYVNFDWKVPAVSANPNPFNISFQDGANVLVSLRTGTLSTSNERTIGAFAGELPGPVNSFWTDPRYKAFSYNTVNMWYTVGMEFDMDNQVATISLTPRDNASAAPSVVTVPFDGKQIGSVILTGERAGGININIEDNGIDNMYFFSKHHSADTVVDILPYDFLPSLPETNTEGALWQSWFKTVYIGDVADEAGLNLPETVKVKTANGETAELGVTWKIAETPWAKSGSSVNMVYEPDKQGVFGYVGTLVDVPGVAVNRMKLSAKLFIENRHREKLATEARSTEWLDRGVVAVPAKGGGILVKWRLLVSEYAQNLSFNVYRNGNKVNASPVTTLNYVDAAGKAGDEYIVEVVQTGEKSDAVAAWATNFIDIPMQRPVNRPNPALAFGGAASDAAPITYTANDCAVADVNGDGKYEILVKWYPSEAQDPGLYNRHTGETIFDCYTLEGELLWRINLGINIVSSAHHSTMNFFDLDQSGKASFAIKTADNTRVYLPKADGTIDDTVDTPAYVIGDPTAVWVGGLQNPARNNAVNNTALGRVASGPEYFTIFNGETGEPIDTVDYFAPYSISPDWGDDSNNRSDRFNGAVAYLPKFDEPGRPYPTVIEVRGHYGPHFVAAYQLIEGKIIEVWKFTLSDWSAGGNQGNHQISIADVDFDGFDEIIFGSIVIDHDGSIVWSANGTRGTIATGHGDAMHVSVMTPYTDEFYVYAPHESGPPNNVTLYNGSTGEPIWTYSANSSDVGRGVAANVTALPGFEVWASAKTPMFNIVTGEILTNESGEIGEVGKAPVNFVLYWDGDLLSEFLDGPEAFPLEITKLNYNIDTKEASLDLVQSLTGTYSNNGTKANPCLTADIFGDWREEVIVRTQDDNFLRIYTTDIPTDYVIYTLMHDPTYRLAVNCQNAMYNQPAHLGFYLGEDIRDQVLAMNLPVPDYYYTSAPEPVNPNEIEITGVSNGNGQADVYFDIKSANGKGYTLYLSETGAEGMFKVYNDLNYNSKGAHIKGLNNGKTYYVYIQYSDGKRSDVVVLNPNKK